MVALLCLRAAALASVAAASSLRGEGQVSSNGSSMALDISCAAGMLAFVALGLYVTYASGVCNRGAAARGGAGPAEGVPKASPTVLGMPLGRELFDKLFLPAAVADEPMCVVCLMPVGRSEPCRRLGCGHMFHPDCIDGWWLQTDDATLKCPVCRRAQVPPATPCQHVSSEEARQPVTGSTDSHA
ncbi:unnamed protein product [Prorocentrum cordatum]|uniref:RING-type domain-containing protein n=1 Tax=Prorocentrum cordatum TaxID=2364126 RepID=A0ABN9PSX1_9DINO|nr:unnamed protein product [Polarella glacialis]